MIYYPHNGNSRETVEFYIMRRGNYATTCVVDVDLLICGIKKFPCGDGTDKVLTPHERREILELVQNERRKITGRETVKSLAGWQRSGLNLDEYVFPGDMVAEDIVNEMVNSVPPRLMRASCTQVGEPYSSEPGNHGEIKETYATFHRAGPNLWVFDGFCFFGENVNRNIHPGRLEMALMKAIEEE